MRKVALVTVILLIVIMTVGCGVKYLSEREVPFGEAGSLTVTRGVDNSEAWLTFSDVVWSKQRFGVWCDIENDINVEYRKNFNGTAIKFRPSFYSLVFGVGKLNRIEVKSLTIIAGNRKDAYEWTLYIYKAKNSFIRTKRQLKQEANEGVKYKRVLPPDDD